jgi:hypothetical protein
MHGRLWSERNGATAMTAYQELTEWINTNQQKFAEEKYTIEDIVKLALACGFKNSAVVQWRTRQQYMQVA